MTDKELNMASEWALGFSDAFLDKLEEESAAGVDWSKTDKWAWRTSLYGIEGFKVAAMNGTRFAMKDRGARSWKRILGESKSGPCPLCVADSKVMHDINDPFLVLHPNESCSMQDMYLRYYTNADSPTVEVPVPGAPNDLHEIIKSGFPNYGKWIIRRQFSGS